MKTYRFASILIGAFFIASTSWGKLPTKTKVTLPTLEVKNLLENANKWNGQMVDVQGWVTPASPMCTLAFCPKRCCNRCQANLILSANPPAPSPASQETKKKKAKIEEKMLEIVTPEGKGLGCQGNDCDWRNKCDVVPGKYRMHGKLKRQDARYQFLVEKALPIEDETASTTSKKKKIEQVSVSFGEPKKKDPKASETKKNDEASTNKKK